jgi:hypothetical protein
MIDMFALSNPVILSSIKINPDKRVKYLLRFNIFIVL